MSTLSLPPTHPKFPAAPVLHAICAMGSLYTAAVTSPPLPNFDQVDADEIFQAKIRLRENRPDSFAEQQAKLAQQTADHLESVGECMFQVLQGEEAPSIRLVIRVVALTTPHVSSCHVIVVLLVSFKVRTAFVPGPASTHNRASLFRWQEVII